MRTGPATWIGLDGAVTLFSPRLGGCVGLEGAAAREVTSERPTDPLLRLAALDGPLVGAALDGPLVGGPRREPSAAVRLADAVSARARLAARGVDASAWRVHHRVLGHLWPSRAHLDPQTAAEVEAAHGAAVERHLRALSDLLTWRSLMDAAGIAWMVVKGPAVAARYARPDARTWGDLDLLVAPEDLGAALTAVTGAGWHLADRNHTLLARVVPSEVHVVAPSGTVVDLHWSLTSTRVRSRGVGTTTAGLFERSGEMDVGGVTVPTLGDADTLVHLCVHAAASGGDRLGWLVDVAACAPTDPGGWRAVVGAARRWSSQRAVAGMLVRTAGALGAGAVDTTGALAAAAVLRRGDGGRWGAGLQRAVEGFFPPMRSAGGATPGWRLARSWVGLRPSLSGAALLAAGRRRRVFVDGAGDPGSALHATGTLDDLGQFLADVARRDGAPNGTSPPRRLNSAWLIASGASSHCRFLPRRRRDPDYLAVTQRDRCLTH